MPTLRQPTPVPCNHIQTLLTDSAEALSKSTGAPAYTSHPRCDGLSCSVASSNAENRAVQPCALRILRSLEALTLNSTASSQLQANCSPCPRHEMAPSSHERRPDYLQQTPTSCKMDVGVLVLSIETIR